VKLNHIRWPRPSPETSECWCVAAQWRWLALKTETLNAQLAEEKVCLPMSSIHEYKMLLIAAGIRQELVALGIPAEVWRVVNPF
jgi:hypothetical protein